MLKNSVKFLLHPALVTQYFTESEISAYCVAVIELTITRFQDIYSTGNQQNVYHRLYFYGQKPIHAIQYEGYVFSNNT
jgi:hypothetical protein